MPKTYLNTQDVLNDIRFILNECASRKNKIDVVALTLNTGIIENSDVPERDFNTTVVAAYLSNLIETTTDSFDTNTKLKFSSNMIEDADGRLQAWTVISPYENYGLVFAGKLDKEENLQIHQATVLEYVTQLIPLIKEYNYWV